MSFESRRDLGCCACPWLAAAGARLPAEPAGPGRGASPSSQRRRRLARRWESLKPPRTGPGKALAPRSERFRPKRGAGAVLGQAFWGIPPVFGASPAGCHLLEVTKTCPAVSAVMLGVPWDLYTIPVPPWCGDRHCPAGCGRARGTRERRSPKKLWSMGLPGGCIPPHPTSGSWGPPHLLGPQSSSDSLGHADPIPGLVSPS